MNIRKSTFWIMPLAMLGGFLIVSPMVKAAGAAVKPAEVPDSEHVSKLLSEAKTLAFQVKEDAATMETFTREDVSWQGHAAAIMQMKDDYNALARQVTKLKEARDMASPWQRTAIDRITPFMNEMVGYTSAVIEHLNGQPKHTLTEYKDYLEANADYSADLAAMIANFVDYGNHKAKMEHLGAKLEIGAGK